MPVSNPSTVMQMIESADRDGLSGLFLNPSTPHHPQLKLHLESGTPDTSFDESLLDQAPSLQMQQLVDYLKKRQKDLDQREANLQSQIYEWDKQTLTSAAKLKRQQQELAQHLTQVECQQDQLMKLQQNLVDSQAAIRRTVERLIDNSHPSQLAPNLALLQNQLDQRFDSIQSQWEQLTEKQSA